MRLFISAIPSKNKKYDGKECFPIFVSLEGDGVDSLANLKNNWSLGAFPLKDKEVFDVVSHRNRMNNILSYQKEIGSYCASKDLLFLDKESLYHYILLGCDIQKALKRILLRLLPEMLDFQKFKFDALYSFRDFCFKTTAPILERSEEVRKKLEKYK